MEFGTLPSLSSSRVLPSGAMGVSLFLLLILMLRWSEIGAARGFAAIALPNKLVLRSDLRDLASPVHPFADLRGGERRGVEEDFNTATWSTSSAVHRRPGAAIPSIQIAEGRLLRDLALLRRRQLYFNLLARQPNGRPSCSFSVAFIIDSAPSGLVPGDGEDGCVSRLQSELGGEGLDCVPISRCRVLFAFLEDLVVFSLIFVVLFVICSPTDET